jgi:hypothetical protein
MRVCELSDLHAFVTDAPPPRAFADACARAGVTLEIAEVEEPDAPLAEVAR